MKKISYKKLFKLMIDVEMNKKELAAKAGISTATLTKMSRNEPVNMDMILKICIALDCGVEDIVELIPDEVTDTTVV